MSSLPSCRRPDMRSNKACPGHSEVPHQIGKFKAPLHIRVESWVVETYALKSLCSQLLKILLNFGKIGHPQLPTTGISTECARERATALGGVANGRRQTASVTSSPHAIGERMNAQIITDERKIRIGSLDQSGCNGGPLKWSAYSRIPEETLSVK